LLDEATSALDSESERLIQQTIRELHSTCTIFIIAHRLSTAQQADMVLVLDSGRVLEKGTVEQLMAYDSYYLRVLSMQGNVEGQTSL
jgi:ABC-type multidrug transport system fused ATPase/permease subunit